MVEEFVKPEQLRDDVVLRADQILTELLGPCTKCVRHLYIGKFALNVPALSIIISAQSRASVINR